MENLFAEYQKAFVKKVAPKKSDDNSGQMSIFDFFENDNTEIQTEMQQTPPISGGVDASITVPQGDATLCRECI